MKLSQSFEEPKNMTGAGYLTEKAVDPAVERCLSEDVMTDVLRVYRKEVTTMFLEEFDEEAYRKATREKGYDEGYNEGCDSCNILVSRLLEDNRFEDLKRSTVDKAFRRELLREFELL